MIPPHVTQEDLSRHAESLIETFENIHRQQAIAMESVVARGFEQGLRKVLNDPEITAKFWAGGFEHFSDHASNNASQWVGKRLLTAALFAAMGLMVTWLVKIGAFK